MKKFKEFVDNFSVVLKEKGFTKNGYNYRLPQSDNIALINIQKSIDRVPGVTKFTLNIGIYFNTLFYFRTGEIVQKPIINDCQWSLRIGNLLPISQDYWWVVNNHSDMQIITDEVIQIFNTSIYPSIISNISDKSFINHLLDGDIAGTTLLEKLIFLSSFFCIYSDPRLSRAMQELKDYCHENKLMDLYKQQVDRVENWKGLEL
jgi:hypothetical protein